MIYFDAAYIAKCYLNEPGADRVRQVAYAADGLASCELGRLEFACVIKPLPTYFRYLADGMPAEHFAREVDRAIADFADYDRPKHLAAARRVANAEQRVALRSLSAGEQRRSRRA